MTNTLSAPMIKWSVLLIAKGTSRLQVAFDVTVLGVRQKSIFLPGGTIKIMFENRWPKHWLTVDSLYTCS